MFGKTDLRVAPAAVLNRREAKNQSAYPDAAKLQAVSKTVFNISHCLFS